MHMHMHMRMHILDFEEAVPVSRGHPLAGFTPQMSPNQRTHVSFMTPPPFGPHFVLLPSCTDPLMWSLVSQVVSLLCSGRLPNEETPSVPCTAFCFFAP